MRVLLTLCCCLVGPRPSRGETLQVIGAGLPRTGTQTLALALNTLGYRVLHSEGFDLKERGVYVGSRDLYMQIVRVCGQIWKGRVGFEALDPVLVRMSELGINATTDVPWSFFVDDLMQRFPDAKIILTVRDAEQWYESYYKVHRLISIFPEKIHPGITYKKRGNRLLEGCDHIEAWPPRPPTLEDRGRCIASFERHNSEIRASVLAGSLLVYDVGQGWGPLCAFLKRELPSAPFPRRDDVGADVSLLLPAGCGRPTVASTAALYALQLGPALCCCFCCFHWRRRRRAVRGDADAKKVA